MSYKEEFHVSGSQAVEKVKSLIRQGNVTHLRIKQVDGDFSLEMPVTVGAVVGGALVLAAPWLAVIGAAAAFFTDVKIEVEREDDAEEAAEPEDTASEATASEDTGAEEPSDAG